METMNLIAAIVILIAAAGYVFREARRISQGTAQLSLSVAMIVASTFAAFMAVLYLIVRLR
jgi:hypothetical protein